MSELAKKGGGEAKSAGLAARRKVGGAQTARGRPLNGAEKSLIFLVSLDEEVATKVLSNLDDDEVRSLRAATESLNEVDPQTIVDVHKEFTSKIQSGVPTSLRGSGPYLRRIAGRALGEGRVAELWEERQAKEGAVAALASLDTPTILALLEGEQPQTVAFVLSQLDAKRAAEILGEYQSEQQAEVMLRLARMESVPEAVVDGIEAQFAIELTGLREHKRRRVRGMECASLLLKRMRSDQSQELLEELASADPGAADFLRKEMFTFEDLVRLDGRGMQTLLKEIATDQLTIALKTASDELKDKVFANLSSRAAQMLRDELDMLGPVRVSEVEEAQAAIAQVALELERDGRLQIASEGGGDFV